MKNTWFTQTLLIPALFGIAANHATAAVITLDFLDLAEHRAGDITGQLGGGSDYAGLPVAAAYEFFHWNVQGLEVTAYAEYLPEDVDGNVIEILPSYVYLQPHYAGLGVCRSAECSQASRVDYYDKLFLAFNQQVEINSIRFSIGVDDATIPPDEDDYRAYNTRLNLSGAETGPMSDVMGPGREWRGALSGNALSFYRPEGTGFFVKSITVSTANVPEPPAWGLILLGVLLGSTCVISRRRSAAAL